MLPPRGQAEAERRPKARTAEPRAPSDLPPSKLELKRLARTGDSTPRERKGHNGKGGDGTSRSSRGDQSSRSRGDGTSRSSKGSRRAGRREQPSSR